jgi:hypothetical protein
MSIRIHTTSALRRSVQPFVAILLLAAASLAQAQSSNWRFFAGVGVADGGETITSGTIVTDGTNKITPFTIKAGGGTQLRAGMEYRLMDRLSLQGSLGYVISDPMGYNGSLTFTAVPVELMAFVNISDSLRLGAGVRKTHAEMKGTGVASAWSVNGTYTGSAASVVEAQYLFGSGDAKTSSQRTQFGISIRAVNETLTHDGFSINGNHYEVGAALYF